MSCRTGTAERAEVERVLAQLGWYSSHDDAFLERKRAEVLAKLPDGVREEIESTDPVLITTYPDVWGLASFDRRHLLHICLFNDDLDVLKRQCARVAVAFPRGFTQVLDGRTCEFDPDVEVHRFDGNELIARGRLNDTGRVGFGRYVWTARRRERVILLVLAGLTVASTALGVLLFAALPGEAWAYVRGYLDRFATAFFTAGLITAVGLVFEYRDWRSAKAVVDWTDA